MGHRIPDGFGSEFRIATLGGGAALIAWGDGVDDLTVGEKLTVPMEMGRQIVGCLGDPRSDDEPQPGVVKLAQIAAGEHAGISDDDDVGDPVACLE